MDSRPSVEEVFEEYKRRREGIIRALTTDVDDFFALCDPESSNILCLLGHSNGTWEVCFPPLNLPSGFPHPKVRINHFRDLELRNKWLLVVAEHSDTWLNSMASYFQRQVRGRDRKRLDTLINDQQTVKKSVLKHLKGLYGGNEYECSCGNSLVDVRPSVGKIFKEYKKRRKGVFRALTTDVEEFFTHCDPAKDNLCLYGHSNGTWEVKFPLQHVLSEIPEPTAGINFSRDGMSRSDWLSMVAYHSDAWLISVTFYRGPHLHSSEREPLFTLINGLPTVHEDLLKHQGFDSDVWYETVHGMAKAGNNSVEGDHAACRKCSGKNSDEFQVTCKTCGEWYHGKCVRVTPSQAENPEKYICPYCRCKQQRLT